MVTLVLTCALAACGPASTAPDGGSASGEASQTSETFDTPSPEPTTTTDPVDPTTGGGSPSISVARLPVGGDSEDSEQEPALQCAHVTWIASQKGQIPHGTAVEITEVLFDPPAFEVVQGGCGTDLPDCAQYQFRSGALRCDLAVRATAQVREDANPSLGFGGVVHCPEGAEPACQAFASALGNEQQLSVSLNVPQLPVTTTTDTTTTTTTDTTTTQATTTDTTTTDGG